MAAVHLTAALTMAANHDDDNGDFGEGKVASASLTHRSSIKGI